MTNVAGRKTGELLAPADSWLDAFDRLLFDIFFTFALPVFLRLGHAGKALRDASVADTHKLTIHMSSYRPNVEFISSVAEKWSVVRGALGERVWEAIGHEGAELLAAYGNVNPALRRDLIASLVSEGGETGRRGSRLNVYAQEHPQSLDLMRLCLGIVGGKRDRYWHGEVDGLIAGDILGRRFNGNADVLKELEAVVARGSSIDGAVVGLCVGWPRSEMLEFLSKTDVVKRPRMLVPSQIYLAALKMDAQALGDVVTRWLDSLRGDIWDFRDWCARPIVERARTDDIFVRVLFEILNRCDKSAWKVSIARILGQARGLTPELQSHCEGELERQLGRELLPEYGRDIGTGDVRPVVHGLLEILLPSLDR